MNFIEFCKSHNLNKEEALACARFLCFIRNEKNEKELRIAVDCAYKKESKKK